MNKVKIIIGAIVLIVVGLVIGKISVPTAPNGGDIYNVVESRDGFRSGPLPISTNWDGGTIGQGQNQGYWKNTLGRTVYVDYAEMLTTGTASTSNKFYVATSSASSLSSDFTAPFSALIDAFSLATSTTVRAINSVKDAGTNGRATIPVTDGQYVIFTWQQNTTACTGTSGLCGTATSTDRGFNVNYRLRYHF